jgi:hypothetical protein
MASVIVVIVIKGSLVLFAKPQAENNKLCEEAKMIIRTEHDFITDYRERR